MSIWEVKELPMNDHEFYILNQDLPQNEGTHWVLLFRIDDDALVYFDSFGDYVPFNISQIADENKDEIWTNLQDIQQFGATSCGYWCMYVADKLLKGKDFFEIINSLTPDGSAHNENKLKKHFSLG